MSWDTKMSPCLTCWQYNFLHRGFIEPLQENLWSSVWGKYLLFTYPARNFLPCMPFSQPASFSKNKALQYHVLTGRASSPSDFHFKCEKYDEKWRLLVWFCFALQLKSVKMLGFCPCWTLTQKIELNQQLSTLVLPCEVQSTSPSPLMTHKWNRCSLV